MLKKKVDSNYEYIYQWMNKYKDDADRRGELLKKSKIYFDWFVFEYEMDHIEGFDLLMSELDEELADAKK